MALSTVRGAVARTFAALLALAASGCNSSSTPSNLAEGAACTEHHECGSQICYQGRCSAGRDGAPCTSGIYITGCATGFTCLDKTCLGPERLAALEAAKEHELLERSGVEVAARTPVVEQPAPPAAGPGARIRVVSIKAKGSAFASCRGDERLTGGSCTGWNLKENGPTRFGPDDTMGARWSCRAVGPEVELTAVALCASTR